MGRNGRTAAAVTETQVAIILDRSGSMEDCRDATISGYNEYLQGLRVIEEAEGVTIRVTLTVFNTVVEIADVGARLGEVKPLIPESYVPHGGTAMLDAVGLTLGLLEGKAAEKPDTSFLVCVISDGLENASAGFTYEQIAERIGTLTATGRWTFAYLGSNQDLAIVAERTGIPRGNMRSYAATEDGTRSAWREQALSSQRNIRRTSQGLHDDGKFYRAPELGLPEREDDPHT